MAEYSPGSLIAVRGREWVILPSHEPDVLRLKPVTGATHGETSLFIPLEENEIQAASFSTPATTLPGDLTGARVLYNAARLSLRSGAAPFRSLGQISVAPRPYQFVPLILALRQSPIRLLIADDVGVGKTIEAGLIARELLDRGIAQRLGVLCPAHLCDQWEQELREKFGLEPVVVDSANFARLERARPRQDISVYAHYPHFVASIDLVKSPRHREHFLRDAPDLVLVDEAHGATRPRGNRGKGQQQRYELLRKLAENQSRHLVLTTATPHSGIEESFRSLLGFLDKKFDVDSNGDIPHLDKKALVPYFVQRRRKEVENWLGADTPFPTRRPPEERKYELSGEYHNMVQDVIDYCRDAMRASESEGEVKQRVRMWGAISLLRSILSSPAAAQAVLGRRRKKSEDGVGEDPSRVATVDDIDHLYRPEAADFLDEELIGDVAPSGALEDDAGEWTETEIRKLRALEKRAAKLQGLDTDNKAQTIVDVIDGLLTEGFNPIVFCRFIPTAHYVANILNANFGRNFAARSVTGELGDDERREVIRELVEDTQGKKAKRVLVATDCLSEGINLQENFDSVVHYDLPWNPNRLEQREGRVDRFGQKRREVKCVTLIGTNSVADQVVRQVLLDKATTIRQQLGISLPVPADSEDVVRGVLSDILFRGERRATTQIELALDTPEASSIHKALDEAAQREQALRDFFAHERIKPEVVDGEMRATEQILGTAESVEEFLADALPRFGGKLELGKRPESWLLHPGRLADRFNTILGPAKWPLEIAFDRLEFEKANSDDENIPLVLGRTHPVAAALCDAVLDVALSEGESDEGIMLPRTGAVFTNTVKERTAVTLLRLRYRFLEDEREEFAEEVVVAVFTKGPDGPKWILPIGGATELLEASQPIANMPDIERREHADWALGQLAEAGAFAPLLEERRKTLTDAHKRIRKLLKEPNVTVHPYPPDILGCFVLVPGGAA